MLYYAIRKNFRETDLALIFTMFYPIIEPLIVIYFLLKSQIKKAMCSPVPVASIT